MTGRSSSTGSESDYSITGAHGTCAAITNQEHYDSRHNRHDDATKGRIDFPRRMYGREEEVRRLAAVWEGFCCVGTKDGVSGGRGGGNRVGSCPRVMFVSGYSGVGKSALVRYFVRRTKEERRGRVLLLYACGKFNENSKCVPFSAFMELLEQLVCEIRHTSELEEWRRRFQMAVANSGNIGPNTEGDGYCVILGPCCVPCWMGHGKRRKRRRGVRTPLLCGGSDRNPWRILPLP
ncbi:hypothetical protein HJC23_008974 [Cyclotella cryptica]|uniref:Orc1-like AAA ATPase domain-containing protein n=1 Tax=Cyclotella cryptica TaxID=29204 RepID=A0ABD3QYZ3_9STRA